MGARARRISKPTGHVLQFSTECTLSSLPPSAVRHVEALRPGLVQQGGTRSLGKKKKTAAANRKVAVHKSSDSMSAAAHQSLCNELIKCLQLKSRLITAALVKRRFFFSFIRKKILIILP